mmetsp:Transcript_101207/g.123935  ORF Transcript_101207/g.123935 Transcript_101207/m.123935 type:complete len:98 (+) Transcript_101207:858-1151(+)
MQILLRIHYRESLWKLTKLINLIQMNQLTKERAKQFFQCGNGNLMKERQESEVLKSVVIFAGALSSSNHNPCDMFDIVLHSIHNIFLICLDNDYHIY